MQLPHYTKKDWLIIITLLPPVVVVINYWIFGSRYFTDKNILLAASGIALLTGFISWQLQIMVAIKLQQKFPLYHQTIRRLLYAIIAYIILTSFTISVVFWLYDLISFFDYSLNVMHLVWSLIAGIIVDVLGCSFHEGVAFYERWKKVEGEAEQLKQENLQSQLESLKAQVNPHFLFNSLNSLSSLISEDSAKAEKFLDELSKVYRYLLRNNEDDLTTLHAEMQFIQSYYHLLKTRYGDSLLLKTQIDDKYLDYMLPPLTLQMLVENAVKHNVMMKDLPLRINISICNGKLVISNNLQRKVRRVSSNRIGLGNIAKKYKILKQENILVQETSTEFSVVIPLIKDNRQW
jgi:sensor histidine kinase YesM